MEKTKLIIDVDGALKEHNAKNPENKMKRKELAEKLDLAYQSLTNYQGGKIPDIVGVIYRIIEITGVDFKNLVKPKNEQ